MMPRLFSIFEVMMGIFDSAAGIFGPVSIFSGVAAPPSPNNHENIFVNHENLTTNFEALT